MIEVLLQTPEPNLCCGMQYCSGDDGWNDPLVSKPTTIAAPGETPSFLLYLQKRKRRRESNVKRHHQ